MRFKSFLSILPISILLLSCGRTNTSLSTPINTNENTNSTQISNSKITLSTHEISEYKGKEFTLNYETQNISNFNFDWTIEDNSIVELVKKTTLSATFKGLKGGTTSLKIYWLDDASVFDICSVTILENSTDPSSWPQISSDAGDYYSTIDFTQSPELLLTALNNLNTALKQPIKYGSEVNKVLMYAQADPDKEGNIILFYSGESRAYNGSSNNVNKEHTWPKSRGQLDKYGSNTAHSDPHMLRLTDSKDNSSRENNVYGEQNDSSCYYVENDLYKGESARCVFYEHMAYNAQLGLILDDDPSFTSGVSKNMGKVSVLLKWDAMNPVSNHLIEKQENNRVQEKLGNRNPFIDIPGLSLYLYGGINEKTKEIYKTYAESFGLNPTMYDY